MVKQRYSLSDLPYAYDALEPVISEEILKLHHDKHHMGYVSGTNSALELLEKGRHGDAEINVKAVMKDLSFNMNGHLLHEIFWTNMRKPKKGNEPSAVLSKVFDESFGCIDYFKEEFSAAAASVEGSGWSALLRSADNDLFVMQIEKHNLLSIVGFTPVLVLDVWEHAYYPDYKNDRKAYIDAWWDVVNWDDVDKRLEI
jgi:superoxide dismutase, Fe-Mn family